MSQQKDPERNSFYRDVQKNTMGSLAAAAIIAVFAAVVPREDGYSQETRLLILTLAAIAVAAFIAIAGALSAGNWIDERLRAKFVRRIPPMFIGIPEPKPPRIYTVLSVIMTVVLIIVCVKAAEYIFYTLHAIAKWWVALR